MKSHPPSLWGDATIAELQQGKLGFISIFDDFFKQLFESRIRIKHKKWKENGKCDSLIKNQDHFNHFSLQSKHAQLFGNEKQNQNRQKAQNKR